MPKARNPPTQWHMLMLYADSADHDLSAVLETLAQSDVEYIGICHDQDVYADDAEPVVDDDGNVIDPGHNAGDIKKAHHHILLYTPAKMTCKAIATGLGIPERFCKNADGLDYVLYMVHIGHIGKHEYMYTDLYGSKRLLERGIRRCVNAKVGVTGGVGESVTEVYQLFSEWLDTQGNVSRRDILDWATSADVLGHVLRNYAAFWSVAQEHGTAWADSLSRAECQRIEKKLADAERRFVAAVKRVEMYERLLGVKFVEEKCS